MRSKTSLVLMERVIVVLVFALAVVMCLRAFAVSNSVSMRNHQKDQAVLLAQNTAETIKACGGVEEAAAIVGGTIQQTLWSMYYNEDLTPAADADTACYHVDVLPQGSGVDGLGQAHIEVFLRDEQEGLFALTVAWQERNSNG